MKAAAKSEVSRESSYLLFHRKEQPIVSTCFSWPSLHTPSCCSKGVRKLLRCSEAGLVRHGIVVYVHSPHFCLPTCPPSKTVPKILAFSAICRD